MGINLPVMGGVGGAHVTKYHIVRPGKENVEYDDFLIALPERDHLASMTKETPLFVRYLKVLTEKEGRQEDFDAFYERAKNGLTVESDVFISTDELTALMWKNGYSEEERTAIQSTFPSDYKFHYPEVSVLFSLQRRTHTSSACALAWNRAILESWIGARCRGRGTFAIIGSSSALAS